MSNITIKLDRPRVEALFEPYKHQIADDFLGYRNHVYRTITYAMHFLGDQTVHEPLVETVFVYHDIGLWTARDLTYLEPSEALAAADNEKHQWGMDPVALQGAIHWHHKLLAYKGVHANVIEACRKADWIDATKGLIRKGMPKAHIKKVNAAFPNLGFHRALLRLTTDYGDSTIVGGFKVLRGILKW